MLGEGEPQEVHAGVVEAVEVSVTEISGQSRGPLAVVWVSVIVEPHGVVEEREEEDEEPVGFWRLREEGEAVGSHPSPMPNAVYARVAPRGSGDDGLDEDARVGDGVRYRHFFLARCFLRACFCCLRLWSCRVPAGFFVGGMLESCPAAFGESRKSLGM